MGLALLSTTLFVNAQTTVSGNITDNSGPLPGVTILEKGTTNGTVSDFDGNYTLSIENQNAVLVFSYLGFLTQEVSSSEDEINIIMEVGSDDLEEVVVTGYGSQRKATVTGAITAVKGENISKSPAVNLTNSLAGRLPGLIVVQGSGEPGYDNASIRIRGVNTFGNSSALIVIDGIPDRDGGISRLNAQDIESISVLKDASAAIYGARAANGVILITTKGGLIGEPRLVYSFNAGYSAPTFFPDLANSFEYASILNEVPIYNSIPSNEWGNAWQSI